ncbi:MAG: hypothetical protein ACK4F9_07735, partial [Brevinematia bacterium]
MNRIFLFLTLIFIISCSKTEFDYKNAKVIDIKMGQSGDLAVLYSSNETVNVYTFSKLIKSFERTSLFVSYGTNTYGGYYKVYKFGFLGNKLYIIANKPTLGCLVNVDGKEFGYYTFVTEFSYSINGKMYGYIYNMGGEFDGTNIIGGKYYINVNGIDYGPYDYAQNLIFSETEDTFSFTFKNKGKTGIKFGDYEYQYYNNVIPPKNIFNQTKFIYQIKKDWFLYPNEKLPPNTYGMISIDQNYYLLISNYNKTIFSNQFRNFSVEGKVIDIKKDKKYWILSEVNEGKKLISLDESYGPYQDIQKYETLETKL